MPKSKWVNLKHKKWEVKVSESDRSVIVYVHKGLISFVETGTWFVKEPNIIEKILFKATLESKLSKTVKKARRFADKLNAEEAKFREAIDSINLEETEV